MSLVAPLKVTRQHVDISVDTEQPSVKGWTELEIGATTPNPPAAIFLNARQVVIEKVSIGGEEVPFQYIDSHEALLFKTGPVVRDAAHYSAVAQVVCESPDLVIPYTGLYPVSALRIVFHVREGSTAIVSDQGVVMADNRVDGPSGWFPCFDNLGQRSMFTMTITHAQGLTCIGPGDMNVSAGQQPRTVVAKFKIPYPVHAGALAFVLGMLKQVQLDNLKNSWMSYTGGTDGETFKDTLKPAADIQKKICEWFPLLGDAADAAINFVSLPFLTECIVWPGVVLVPRSMFTPVGNLDVIYDAVPRLMEAMFGLVIYFLFPIADQRDRWIQVGLCALFADILTGDDEWWGQSFRQDRRWNDINWLMNEDIHQSIVLYAVNPVTCEAFNDRFLRVKAKLLMNMILMSLKNKENDLIRLMTPLIKQSQSKDSGPVTDKFMSDLPRWCPKIDFKKFRYQWLMSNGFPIFTYNFTNDNRHNNLKLVMAQTPSCKTRVQFFTGEIIIQLQDLEQPYEFSFAVENQLQLWGMQYFAHRRKTKQKEFIYENGQTAKMEVHHAVMWLIIDQPMSWICRVRPRLPGFMLEYQLQLLRSVYWQHEALSSLDDYRDTEGAVEKLEKILKNDQMYFGVRRHCARALAKFNSEETEFKHMQVLLGWYQDRFCTTTDRKRAIQPNNFHDAENYFVQLEVIKSLSIIRDSRNYTKEKVIEFLLIVLDCSNNNSNRYNDEHFVAEVELACGRVRPEVDSIYEKMVNGITGKLLSYKNVPSVDNVATSAGYIALTALSLRKEGTDSPVVKVKDMRNIVVVENTHYFEARASVFRCLLFLALSGTHDIGFHVLFADIRSLALDGCREMAALCLRELHRFVVNSVRSDDENKFDAYLLSIAESMTREQLVTAITDGDKKLEMAETLWELVTVHGQHHKILRAEAFRAYVTLYGEKLPGPYRKKGLSQPHVELMADRSSGCVLQVDVLRTPTRTPSMTSISGTPKKPVSGLELPPS